MSRPGGRRSEHVRPERPRPEMTQPAPEANGPAEAAPEPESPAMAGKYWVAVLFWAVGFGLMIVYEIVSTIWRG